MQDHSTRLHPASQVRKFCQNCHEENTIWQEMLLETQKLIIN